MALERSLISLFSGAGGLDIGLERAGWETVAASDFSTDCLRTLRNSQDAEISVDTSGDRAFLAGARLLEADIANLRASDLRPNGASPDWRPSLLAGGPPCQPWSSAGLQRGFEDPRGRVVEHYFRLTEELRPRFVLFENVRGLLTAVGREGKPGEALTAILDTFASIGYATRVALVNAADFGAAQRRVRLFVLGSIDHELPTIPEPTHSREVGSGSGHLPWASLGGLLATVPAPDEAEVVRPSGPRAHDLCALQPGKGLRTPGRTEANRPGGHWGYRQDSFLADLTLPARTIRAATTPDWIREPDGRLRRLTWRECVALQGFPPEWAFSGSVASRFRQIGNAVQTDVARAIGEVLLTALKSPTPPAPPTSAALPEEFNRRIRYTEAEHRVNGPERIRVRASV